MKYNHPKHNWRPRNTVVIVFRSENIQFRKTAPTHRQQHVSCIDIIHTLSDHRLLLRLITGHGQGDKPWQALCKVMWRIVYLLLWHCHCLTLMYQDSHLKTKHIEYFSPIISVSGPWKKWMKFWPRIWHNMLVYGGYYMMKYGKPF